MLLLEMSLMLPRRDLAPSLDRCLAAVVQRTSDITMESRRVSGAPINNRGCEPNLADSVRLEGRTW